MVASNCLDLEQGGLKLLGWLLIRREPRPDWGEPEMPASILTASTCFCEVHPEYDDWLEDDRLAFLRDREVNSQGHFIFLDTPRSAWAMNERWFKNELEVIGLAVSPEVFEKFDKLVVRNVIESNPQLAHITTQLEAQAWQGGEKIIGYDVLGYDYGFHTYLCSYLAKLLPTRFGVSLNKEGLIPDATSAKALAQAINSEKLAEPCFYFAVAMLKAGDPE